MAANLFIFDPTSDERVLNIAMKFGKLADEVFCIENPSLNLKKLSGTYLEEVSNESLSGLRLILLHHSQKGSMSEKECSCVVRYSTSPKVFSDKKESCLSG